MGTTLFFTWIICLNFIIFTDYSLFNLYVMQRRVGIILSIFGLIGTVIAGIKAIQDSDSFSIFGLDIAVSSANWTPLIMSVAVLIVGLAMMLSPKQV